MPDRRAWGHVVGATSEPGQWLRNVVVGAASVALLLVLVGSLGVLALSMTLIVDYLRARSDFAIGVTAGMWGVFVMTPVAITSSLALRWVWRRRRGRENGSRGVIRSRPSD